MNGETRRRCRLGMTAVLLIVGGVEMAAQEPQLQPPGVNEHVTVAAEALVPTREALTGTGWLPVDAPMYGVHRPWRGWDLRVNGALFVAAIAEPGDRHRTGGPGTRQAAGLNWGMVTLRRPLGDSRLGLRAMLSAEPATVPGCGVLNFLATGEVCDGDTVHDRQQPHDLVMELAADYDRPLIGGWRWQIYAGVAGEPAFGPPSYAHRPSGLVNPLQPISHHWLDSTSIAFGVISGSVFNRQWKIETSMFNGRDADESRADIDFGALDSVAARVSYLPGSSVALQVSAGRVHEVTSVFPEDQPATKLSASALFQRTIGSDAEWATTIAMGFNRGSETIIGVPYVISSNAALLESSVTTRRHVVFGRAERVAMPAHHLHAHEFLESVFPVGKLQLGYTLRLGRVIGLVPGIGGSVALSFLPSEFAPRYSGSTARSFSLFMNLLPARHVM